MTEKRYRVLLVDDEPVIRKMFGRLLEMAEMDVLTAADGEEGQARALAELPDAIILDLMLPKKNGYDVCVALKQDARTQHIPIIIFSAKEEPGDDERCLKLGASAYVSKTQSPQKLIDEVKAWASGQQGRTA
jgi:CheY-like chemotaxis protein